MLLVQILFTCLPSGFVAVGNKLSVKDLKFMKNRIFIIAAFCIIFITGYGNASDEHNEWDDFYVVEVIIVNKIPREIFASEDMSEEFTGMGWYNIGLSRNGKEPIEYIWRAGKGVHHYDILRAEIGDRGIIHLYDWAKGIIKLPKPNAEKPPIIGVLGEVWWERKK